MKRILSVILLFTSYFCYAAEISTSKSEKKRRTSHARHFDIPQDWSITAQTGAYVLVENEHGARSFSLGIHPNEPNFYATGLYQRKNNDWIEIHPSYVKTLLLQTKKILKENPITNYSKLELENWYLEELTKIIQYRLLWLENKELFEKIIKNGKIIGSTKEEWQNITALQKFENNPEKRPNPFLTHTLLNAWRK